MSARSGFRRRGKADDAAWVEAPGEGEVISDKRYSKIYDADSDFDTSPKDRVSRLDLILAGVLLIFSAWTRFYRLATPSAVVFDEVHFYGFVSQYARRIHLFDIHPPLGKLILLLGGVLGNFRPDFKSENIGMNFPTPQHYMPLRRTSAFFGTLCVPVTYAIARLLGTGEAPALVAGSMVLFENLTLVESRLILVDAQLILFSELALMCALILWRQKPRTRLRWAMVAITGTFCGCAVAIKWTALATPGIITVVSAFGLLTPYSRLSVIECATAVACGAFVYMLSFWVHFKLSQISGQGDPFMDMAFQKTLVHSRFYSQKARRRGFLYLFRFLNAAMLRANASIKTRHPWESKWFEWPFDLRGTLYYRDYEDGKESRIYALGNPAVFWLCTAFMAVFVGIVGFKLYQRVKSLRMRKKPTGPKKSLMLKADYLEMPKAWFRAAMMLFVTYWLNLIPYIFVARAAFIYHYIPGLLYNIFLASVLLDRIPSDQVRNAACAAAIVLCGGAFLFWAPWTYGLPISGAAQMRREWLPRWD